MAELLDRIRVEISTRLTELRPLVDEHRRLEAALRALSEPTSRAPAPPSVSSPVQATLVRARRRRRGRVSVRLAVQIGGRAASRHRPPRRHERRAGHAIGSRAQHAKRATGAPRQGRRTADTSAAHGEDGLRAWRRRSSGARSRCTRPRREHRRSQRIARRPRRRAETLGDRAKNCRDGSSEVEMPIWPRFPPDDDPPIRSILILLDTLTPAERRDLANSLLRAAWCATLG